VDLAGFAAEVRALAARAESGLARDCAGAAARELLAALEVTTPVRTGALRASERIFSVSGGGPAAVAVVGSDLVYAKFRNDGGTIRVKHAKVLGTPAVGFFGKKVTQAGAHYMEAAEAEAIGPIQAACASIVADFLTL
jgi:Bacteriophage HK97-gp10, putative tail-component